MQPTSGFFSDLTEFPLEIDHKISWSAPQFVQIALTGYYASASARCSLFNKFINSSKEAMNGAVRQ